MAFVLDIPCVNVIPVDVDALTFTSEPIDKALSTNNCVVVRSDQGVVFKLGGATESGMRVTFDYDAL